MQPGWRAPLPQPLEQERQRLVARAAGLARQQGLDLDQALAQLAKADREAAFLLHEVARREPS